jgi:hypothetical protein
MKKLIVTSAIFLFANIFFASPSHADAECPASSQWPCVGMTIDSGTTNPSSGGGGSIRYMRMTV